MSERHASEGIEKRIAGIEDDIARIGELLHAIETIEQEHGDTLPAEIRDDLRDEIEKNRRKVDGLITRLDRIKATTPGIGE